MLAAWLKGCAAPLGLFSPHMARMKIFLLIVLSAPGALAAVSSKTKAGMYAGAMLATVASMSEPATGPSATPSAWLVPVCRTRDVLR